MKLGMVGCGCFVCSRLIILALRNHVLSVTPNAIDVFCKVWFDVTSYATGAVFCDVFVAGSTMIRRLVSPVSVIVVM